MINNTKRALRRAFILWLFPEGHELALAVHNADFAAPGCAAVMRKLARAALEALGEVDS